jgi:hypothetical protein
MSLVLRISWGRSLAPFLHQKPSHRQDFASNVHSRCSRLVEETEAHVVVRLLLLLLSLLGLGGGLSGTTSGGSTTSRGGTSTTRGNGGELRRAGRDQLQQMLVACRKSTSYVWGCANFASRIYAYLVDVLAVKLLKERAEALLVGVNANRAEDSLDVLSRGGGVAGQAEEEESCEVLHLVGVCRKALVNCRGGAKVLAGHSLLGGWFRDRRINHV